MAAKWTRRQALEAASAVLAAGFVARAAVGEPEPGLAATDLGSDLLLVRGAGGNVVVRGSSAGLLLVDGGSAEQAGALRALLSEHWPSAPVEVLFNTNWRPEHTGANAALRDPSTQIMAHENTKLWIGGDFFVEWEGRHHVPQPADMLPNSTFYTSGAIEHGGRRVEYWYLPRAHTDGDIAVFFPDANVLVASDLVAVGRYPTPDYSTGGWIGGLEAALETLLDKTDERTRIVAAEGPVLSRRELTAAHEVCAATKQKIARAFREGMSLKDFIASKPTADFDRERGDPSQFLALVYKGAFAHLRELGGVI